MLVEVIPKEPLSFSVFHYKNPKLQHTVQVQQHYIRREASNTEFEFNCMFENVATNNVVQVRKCDDDLQVVFIVLYLAQAHLTELLRHVERLKADGDHCCFDKC